MAWWLHSILHGVNPFVTHAIWAPDGVNLTWIASAPALAVFAPLTLAVGPFVTFNGIAVLMPALSAWSAFFLCRYLTRAVWPALVGGYLFGFSTFELVHVGEGHLPLTSAALLPLAALVILRFLDGDLTRNGFVVRFGPLLALQLLISTEVTLTLSLSLVVAVLLAFALVPERRARLIALVPCVAYSYVLAALLTAPFVYYVLAGFRKAAYNPPDPFHADLLNFVVPTRYNLIAGGASSSLPGITGGEEAYIGIPALLVFALFARRAARTPSGRFVLASFVVAVIASLGAYGNVDGHRIVSLPWALVHGLPLFNNVLTVRIAVYVSLLIAVVTALWTAQHRSGILRWFLPGLVLLAIFPSLTSGIWTTQYSVPAFFTQSSYRFCLDEGENILPLPIGQGDAMLWQAASKFRFNMAAGNVSWLAIPPSFVSSPGVTYVTKGYHLGPEQAAGVNSFITGHDVTSVVVAGNEADFFSGALDRLATGQKVGGVVLYHLSRTPPSCPGPA